MTTEFESRIIREGIVDTRKYRYICKDYADRREIKRLPIEDLDTTAAIDGWETIKVIRSEEVSKAMKYYLIDDCTSTRSAAWTRRIEADSFEDALQKAHTIWAGLTRHDRNDRDSFLVGEVAGEAAAEIEDGEYAGNYMYGKTFEFAANYSIKPEYVEYWGDSVTADEDISVDEIFRLAAEWDTTVESLIEQIEEA